MTNDFTSFSALNLANIYGGVNRGAYCNVVRGHIQSMAQLLGGVYAIPLLRSRHQF